MRRMIYACLAGLAAVSTLPAQAPPPPPPAPEPPQVARVALIRPSSIADRVARAESVVTGKVTSIEEKTISVPVLPGSKDNVEYLVAVVKIDFPQQRTSLRLFEGFAGFGDVGLLRSGRHDEHRAAPRLGHGRRSRRRFGDGRGGRGNDNWRRCRNHRRGRFGDRGGRRLSGRLRGDWSWGGFDDGRWRWRRSGLGNDWSRSGSRG